jgi:glycine dehydrogenase
MALSNAKSCDRAFTGRHIGIDAEGRAKMLAQIGFADLESLMDAAVPRGIRTTTDLRLPAPVTEAEAAEELAALADRNVVSVPMIGLGYHPTITPAVIRRNVLEDPAWYTAYTPYQPEVSQGRLEALLNFQTMVGDLTGLPMSNASLLDECTAVAEAVMVMRRGSASKSSKVLVDTDTLPQTLDVLRTRATAVGVQVVEIDPDQPLPTDDFFGLVLSYPGASRAVRDHEQIIRAAHDRGALVTVAADLLALTMLRPPGEFGADIAVASTQRFAVPMFYGGPHAGFIAVCDGLQRHLPGRPGGVSRDSDERPAYRLALQTREQHIRRDKATSNICTAQVLLAVVASMYAVYHGPDGLRRIAERVHAHATAIASGLRATGIPVVHGAYFDTLLVRVPDRADEVLAAANAKGLRLRRVDADQVGVSCSEITTSAHVELVLEAFGSPAVADGPGDEAQDRVPSSLHRESPFLTHPVFHAFRSETEMLRYLRRLSARDFALNRGMIPLGSCTLKLNATTEMEPISLPGFANMHPFAPAEDASGYAELVRQLEAWLAEVTGYAAVSIQPNAGSQGELAGLLAIRGWHRDRGEDQRDICLIPSSAHGTNAASAVLAGKRVVVVGSHDDGTIDLADLERKCVEYTDNLAAIMVTYPSTHGVYEESITRLCDLVHAHGGQVYVDGANLNALLGIAKPGEFGDDVSHLNLHKTFCIPHGGGGPGVGPVAVAEHLVPYLPTHPLHPDAARRASDGSISAAPYGSAGILLIPWAYIRMMGGPGLTECTQVAVLSANYVAQRLAPHFPILFTGVGGAGRARVHRRPPTGHREDRGHRRGCRQAPDRLRLPRPHDVLPGCGNADDRADRVRKPGRARPVLRRDDRDRRRDRAGHRGHVVGAGQSAAPGAAHLADVVGSWGRSYPREVGVFPAGMDADKYWPPVGRIENAHGDRNLVCSCPAPEAFVAGGPKGNPS